VVVPPRIPRFGPSSDEMQQLYDVWLSERCHPKSREIISRTLLCLPTTWRFADPVTLELNMYALPQDSRERYSKALIKEKRWRLRKSRTKKNTCSICELLVADIALPCDCNVLFCADCITTIMYEAVRKIQSAPCPWCRNSFNVDTVRMIH
jgi:hypothetical protein